MGTPYQLLVVFALFCMTAEFLIRRSRSAPLDMSEGWISFAVGSLSYAVGLVSELIVMVVAAGTLRHVSPWRLSAADPLVWVGFFVIDDALNYAVHVAAHKVPWLWAAHVVHHSAEDLSLISAVRLSPVEALYQPVLVLWAPLVGVPLTVFAPMTALALAIGFVGHTQVIGKLPWLDRWIATPSNHRVHHGTNPSYLDKNFGSSLIIWDRLFGTYAHEIEPVRFGATETLPTTVKGTVFGGYPTRFILRRITRNRSRATTFRILENAQ